MAVATLAYCSQDSPVRTTVLLNERLLSTFCLQINKKQWAGRLIINLMKRADGWGHWGSICLSFPFLEWAKSENTVDHKVRTYKEYHSVRPLVGIGLYQPLSRQRVCPSPRTAGGEGLGESQFRRLEKKLSTLPTLWGGPLNSLRRLGGGV